MSPEPASPRGKRLGRGFYDRSVHDVARGLIGCTLRVNGVGGVVVETESYHAEEPACHAYVGLTPRTAPLFGPPGHAYVYVSYGIHRMLNAVSEPEGEAAAVLIRALEPRWGIDEMRRRRGLDGIRDLCSGPGKLCQALAIGTELNTHGLDRNPFEIRSPEGEWEGVEVVTGPRVGINVAVDLPWRFCASGSRFLSRRAG